MGLWLQCNPVVSLPSAVDKDEASCVPSMKNAVQGEVCTPDNWRESPFPLLPASPFPSFGKLCSQLPLKPWLKEKETPLKQFSKLQHTNKHISHLFLSNHRTSSQKQHSKSLIRDLISCGKITLFILSYLFSVLSEAITQATTEPHRQCINSWAQTQAHFSTRASRERLLACSFGSDLVWLQLC